MSLYNFVFDYHSPNSWLDALYVLSAYGGVILCMICLYIHAFVVGRQRCSFPTLLALVVYSLFSMHLDDGIKGVEGLYSLYFLSHLTLVFFLFTLMVMFRYWQRIYTLIRYDWYLLTIAGTKLFAVGSMQGLLHWGIQFQSMTTLYAVWMLLCHLILCVLSLYLLLLGYRERAYELHSVSH